MADSQLMKEIERRRTFAIISHPDAGKTTLTEKLLLYGGAIHMAGSVKAKGIRYAVSDWMEIEKQRGISVTSSVMQFSTRAFASIFWIRLATRISARTLTAPWLRPTAL